MPTPISGFMIVPLLRFTTVSLIALGMAQGASAQEPPTYENAAVRALVERAAAARRATGEGIESYEAEIRDRIYVGLGGGVFRRERTLFEQARSARVLWTREGADLVMWTGAQQRIPIAGMDTTADEEYLEDFVANLANGQRPFAMLDPRDDILSFGNDGDDEQFLLHPLSDTAAAHYQYFAGDTLTISFVGDEAPVRLAEVRVQPRRVSPRLVAASLWFDLDSGQLARASLRPARPFNLQMDIQGDDIPGFLPPIEFEVRYITIEYSLHERTWWLPRRFAFEGEARVGRWLSVPFLIETTLRDYSVNPVEPELTRDALEFAGWRSGSSMRGRRGDNRDSVIAMVPPLDSLDTSSLLGDLGELEMGAIVFDQGEVDRIRRDLEKIVGQVPVVRRPTFGYGISDGLWRFNRVEGLSVGLQGAMPVAPLVEASATGRIGVADWQPRGELRVERTLDDYSLHWAAYRRLSDGSDFDDPLDLSSSVKVLFTGADRGQFYDAYGTEVGVAWTGRSTGLEVRLFLEDHRAVETETSFHLFKPLTGNAVASNITADEGKIGGVAATLRWSKGTDPTGISAWGSLSGEAASGDFDYQRAFATLGTSLPTVSWLASAFEFGAGTSWGAPPVQRLHYLGGGSTLRGLSESSLSGDSFWFGRAEVGTAFPAFRLAVFGDAGWAGPKDDFTLDDPWVGVGVGASIMDGIIRFDVARTVRRGRSWRLYLYLDGIL